MPNLETKRGQDFSNYDYLGQIHDFANRLDGVDFSPLLTAKDPKYANEISGQMETTVLIHDFYSCLHAQLDNQNSVPLAPVQLISTTRDLALEYLQAIQLTDPDSLLPFSLVKRAYLALRSKFAITPISDLEYGQLIDQHIFSTI